MVAQQFSNLPDLSETAVSSKPEAKSAEVDVAFAAPERSVVLPLHNEAENVAPLIGEIRAALEGGPKFEIICVDDGSTDGTLEALRRAHGAGASSDLRILKHRVCCGQSAAIWTAVKGAAAPLIVTLDGDGQNDPADIPALIERYDAEGGGDLVMIAGHRAKRRDTRAKRWASRLANAIRSAMLGDETPDTGCGLKVFSREAFLTMPRFNHMHRFLPALMLRQGGRVLSVPVNHRPRLRGASKYGVWGRAWVGLIDLFGVMWLKRRAFVPVVDDLTPKEGRDHDER